MMVTATRELTVRVWVPEVWDIVDLTLPPDASIARLKREALEQATGRTIDPSRFVVKFRGALVTNEKRSLADLDVPDQAPFIILPDRRVPVR